MQNMASKNLKYFLVALFSLVVQQSLNAQASVTKSFYVPAYQGTKLAVDVNFPVNYTNQKLPVLFEFTRYWRASENPKTGEPKSPLNKRDKFFLANDYIIVKVNMRNTSTSYGTRPEEYTPLKVKNAKYVIN
jgi:uncharacterized protein